MRFFPAVVLLVAGCGGGGSDSPPPPPSPTVNLSASVQSAKTFDQVTLEWSSTNATGCTASGGWDGSKSTSGEEDVDLAEGENTFEISCSGAGGSASRTVSVEGIAACMHPENLDGIVVSDVDELRDQLVLAAQDGRDTVIYINGGKYEVSEEIHYDAKGSLNRISLIGCGSADVIFDGKGESRIFSFVPDGLNEANYGGETTIPTAHLQDMTILDGYCYGDRSSGSLEGCVGAGGVEANEFNLSAINVVFKGNFSNLDAPAATARNLRVVGTRFTENKFPYTGSFAYNNMQRTIGGSWGVVYTRGSVVLDKTIFDDNDVDRLVYSKFPYWIPCEEMLVSVTDSRFSNNLGVGLTILEPRCDGFSPVKNQADRLIVRRSLFEGHGLMAIDYLGGNALIEDSEFRMNSNGFHPRADTQCDAYFFSGQGATGENDTGHDWDCYHAGGISVDKFMAGHGTLRIVNSKFIDNSSKDFGGAINVRGSINCEESGYYRYQEGCDRLVNGPLNSDAIADYDVDIIGSTFEGNSAHRGAAISVSRIAIAWNSFQLGNVRIRDSRFIDNKGVWGSAPDGWSGVHEDTETSIIVTGGDLNIESTVFQGNSADIPLHVKGTLFCDDSCDGI